jgi:hypothetical protein
MKLADVIAFVSALPGVTETRQWDHRTWAVGDRSIAWERPLRKSDLERLGDTPAPQGDIIAITVEDLDAKDALLAIAPRGFFTIQHFNNYPAVLVELRLARVADVRAALRDAHRTATERAASPKRRSASKLRTQPAKAAKPSKPAKPAKAAKPSKPTRPARPAKPVRERRTAGA